MHQKQPLKQSAPIQPADFIQSIANAFQYISCYHPLDYIQNLAKAYEIEESPAARDAIAQILSNSRMCAIDQRPICQDTGICLVFVKIGMHTQWAATEIDMTIDDMINQGVRQAYQNVDNPLRASVVNPPFSKLGARKNTKDNTPAVIHYEVVAGSGIEIICAAKGGGSENKAKMAMLNPGESVVDWILKTIPTLGAGWCPPGILGVGIGGTPEKAVLMAKESLMEAIDMPELKARGAQNDTEALRLEIYEKINSLGIGAQGLGGLTTVLDVKIMEYPTHAASLPVAIVPNCAATRHIHFYLDGSGAVEFTPPKLDEWPDISWKPDTKIAKRVDLNNLSKEEVASWQPGQTLLLNGKMLTGRDAAHKRISQLLEKGEPLPIDFKGRAIYYVGPVDAVRNEAVGPAGPTTATRMDAYTDMMLSQDLLVMIGKAERGIEATKVIAKHKAAYLIAVGGSAYLVSKAIKKAKVVAFADLGMEAIYEFEVEDMPVTVAVDSTGYSLHQEAPKTWQIKIAQKNNPL